MNLPPDNQPDDSPLYPQAQPKTNNTPSQITRRMAAKRLEGKAAAYGEALDFLASISEAEDMIEAMELLKDMAETLRARRARAMHIRHKLEQRYAQAARDEGTATETPTSPDED